MSSRYWQRRAAIATSNQTRFLKKQARGGQDTASLLREAGKIASEKEQQRRSLGRPPDGMRTIMCKGHCQRYVLVPKPTPNPWTCPECGTTQKRSWSDPANPWLAATQKSAASSPQTRKEMAANPQPAVKATPQKTPAAKPAPAAPKPNHTAAEKTAAAEWAQSLAAMNHDDALTAMKQEHAARLANRTDVDAMGLPRSRPPAPDTHACICSSYSPSGSLIPHALCPVHHRESDEPIARQAPCASPAIGPTGPSLDWTYWMDEE